MPPAQQRARRASRRAFAKRPCSWNGAWKIPWRPLTPCVRADGGEGRGARDTGAAASRRMTWRWSACLRSWRWWLSQWRGQQSRSTASIRRWPRCALGGAMVCGRCSCCNPFHRPRGGGAQVEALTFPRLYLCLPGRGRTGCCAVVDWTVHEGAFVLLVGATGSGKSTLLRSAKPEIAPVGARTGSVSAFGQALFAEGGGRKTLSADVTRTTGLACW